MKPFVYLILLALAFILFKAYYLDSLPNETNPDVNVTEEQVTQEEAVQETKVEEKKVAPLAEEKREEPKKEVKGGWNDKEKFPVDKLGDSIADKIGDKI